MKHFFLAVDVFNIAGRMKYPLHFDLEFLNRDFISSPSNASRPQLARHASLRLINWVMLSHLSS